jgi:hypothetical protein
MAETNTWSNVLLETLIQARDEAGKVYDVAKSGIGKAAAFAQREIPETIKQLLTWEFWYHAVWAVALVVLAVLIFSLFLVVARRLVKAEKTVNVCKGDYTAGAWIVGVVGFVIACMIFFFGAVPNAITCVKIKTAPNVFFLEYCNDLWSHKHQPRFREHNH